ncbi:MAG: TolC family outer membrane protein [Gammaproteobacteria bacterium]
MFISIKPIMLKRPVQFTLASILLLSVQVLNTTFAADLHEIYLLARDSDPQYRQVVAANQATLEQRPQAISQMLFSVDLSANTFNHNQSISSQAFGFTGDVGFNTHGFILNITQPIFHRDRFLKLKQASSKIQQANAELAAAQQDLIIRVAESYFNVLSAKDNLEFAVAEKKSLSRQLEQSQQRFEVGLTAITDVQEARAGHDRAVADEIEAKNNVDNTLEALREIIGVYQTGLAILGDSMPLVSPEPDDIDTWTDTALKQNLDVAAALHAVDTEREEVKVQYAGHLPTLDLGVTRSFNTSGGRFGSTKVHDTALGLRLNIPLIQGGFVSSKTREALHRLDEQLQRLEQARRQAQRATRESFLGVISGISRVKALKQALISSETALYATRSGFEVGTRTAVDVVDSERVTFQARRDYARARYDYILDTLRLKRAAGTLSTDDILTVNQWLN